MEWTNIKKEKPQISGPYIISITKPYSNGEYIFNYYAFFNLENNSWYKYDSENSKVGDKINEEIIGWIKGLTTYLG
ncbi:hypothetical protein [Soonwooa purpurea]